MVIMVRTYFIDFLLFKVPVNPVDSSHTALYELRVSRSQGLELGLRDCAYDWLHSSFPFEKTRLNSRMVDYCRKLADYFRVARDSGWTAGSLNHSRLRLRFLRAKVFRRTGAKENICGDQEQYGVHCQLIQGVEAAKNRVVCDPNHRQPARPVAAPKHIDSTNNCQETDEANP